MARKWLLTLLTTVTTGFLTGGYMAETRVALAGRGCGGCWGRGRATEEVANMGGGALSGLRSGDGLLKRESTVTLSFRLRGSRRVSAPGSSVTSSSSGSPLPILQWCLSPHLIGGHPPRVEGHPTEFPVPPQNARCLLFEGAFSARTVRRPRLLVVVFHQSCRLRLFPHQL